MYYYKIDNDNYRDISIESLLKKEVFQIVFSDDIPSDDLFVLMNNARKLGVPSITLRIKSGVFFPVLDLIQGGVTEVQYSLDDTVDFKRFVRWSQELLKESKKYSPQFNIMFHVFMYAGFDIKKLLLLLKGFFNKKNIYMYYIGEVQQSLLKVVLAFISDNTVKNFFFVENSQTKISFSGAKILEPYSCK